MASTVDFGAARPAEIPGLDSYVWLAPTADGGLCTFKPQPGGMDGQVSWSCATLDDLNTSGSVSVTYGRGDRVIVMVVQPDGVPEPLVTSNAGTTRAVPYIDNVAVTTARYGDTVKAAGVKLTIAPPVPFSTAMSAGR